jgi:hypothetical protein
VSGAALFRYTKKLGKPARATHPKVMNNTTTATLTWTTINGGRSLAAETETAHYRIDIRSKNLYGKGKAGNGLNPSAGWSHTGHFNSLAAAKNRAAEVAAKDRAAREAS